jgi:hypothetical protein
MFGEFSCHYALESGIVPSFQSPRRYDEPILRVEMTWSRRGRGNPRDRAGSHAFVSYYD